MPKDRMLVKVISWCAEILHFIVWELVAPSFRVVSGNPKLSIEVTFPLKKIRGWRDGSAVGNAYSSPQGSSVVPRNHICL